MLLISAEASAQTDSSLFRQLDSTVVAASRNTSVISGKAETRVKIADIAKLPSLLGSADPIRFVQLLPSVQTGSEIDAGIHIQGCDHGHNIISLDGTPIYNASHLLGLFSVFNPSHFEKMSYNTFAEASNRLGGRLDLIPFRKAESPVEGNINLGLIASQAGIRARCGASTIALSARKTFLNSLYKPYLEIDEDPFEYGFGDVNLSWHYDGGKGNTLDADVFYSSDAASYNSLENYLKTDVCWSNAAATVHWGKIAGELRLRNSAYASSSVSKVDISHIYAEGSMPSHIRSFGYKSEAGWKGLDASAELHYYDVLPQQPQSSSLHTKEIQLQERQNGLETSLRAGWTGDIGYRWNYSAWLHGCWYLSPEKESFFSLSPSASLRFSMFRAGKLELKAGAATQNLFQTGITSLGLPVEFYFLAGRYGAPQRSLYSGLSYSLDFLHESWNFSASAYYRRLYNQVEYVGTILDFLNSNYSLENSLMYGDGWNYGINLMLHKQAGRLTGWVSYALGRSLRSDDNGIYPSNYERIHEMNMVATYSGRRWDLGGTLVAASGAPFTAPEAIYINGNKMICRYSAHNGARYQPYIRLDLSFNWYFRNDGKVSHGINASVYNALGRRNEIGNYFHVSERGFVYKPFSYALRFMPGIGWFYRF